MNLPEISIKRPTFITAVVAVMIIVGFIMMNRMSVDLFPDVNFPFVSVTTVYPGAGPREVETLISKKLEDQISSIAGLKNVSSTSQDGVSTVWGEFYLETDPKYAEQQVRDKIALVRNQLPDDIKEPVIKRFDPSDQPVMVLSLKAELPQTELYDLADTTVKDGLQQVPNVSTVEIIGGTKREIHVNLDRTKLKEYETSVTMVSARVAANSQNVPIGKVTEGKKDLSFRTLGEFRFIKEIRDVVVSFFSSDIPVTLSKLGEVTDASEDEQTRGYLNGRTALVLNVYKQSEANTVSVSDNLQKKMLKLNQRLKGMKGSPEIIMARDGAKAIRMNITDVKITIFQGIMLAILVVYMFLGNFRSTLITVIALPNSLIGAFIFMGLAGFSINMLTLMALSLAVGLLLDDAIVVRENIFRHIENGQDPKIAAKEGTHEVMLAVIATTLTVIAVFLPVGFLQGTVGQFFKEFGLTIVFAMCISLFDALTTAPMLSAYLITKTEKNDSFIVGLLHAPAVWFGKGYDVVEHLYGRFMHYTLRHKNLVLIIAVAIFFATMGLVTKIPKTFMPANEWGEFMVSLEAAPGTSLDEMSGYAKEVEATLLKEKDIDIVQTTVGNTNNENEKASMYVVMVPEKKRSRTTGQMKDYVRNLLVKYKGVLETKVSDMSLAGEDYPFMLMFTGENLDQLEKVVNGILPKIAAIDGLVDVASDYKHGKPEFQVRMYPAQMEKLGVMSMVAGGELRGMVEGNTPAKFRENGLEYDIRVRLKEDQRNLSKYFDSIYVPNVNNQLVKLKNVSAPLQTTGPSKIFRRNKARYIMITGNLGPNGATGSVTFDAEKILKDEKLPEGVEYQFLGSTEDMKDLFKNMLIAAVLSIVFIYLVLASLYESTIVPFTIMISLPLAIIGGFVALYITGQSLNMFTMIGFIMLLGLVTKNSILLVDFTQKLMVKGENIEDALVRAGKTRLRPILMTTFALIAGMVPVALGLSEVGKFRKSMGIAIIGGLLSSTILTLVVIPAVFGYMDSVRRFFRKLFRLSPKWEDEEKDSFEGDDVTCKANGDNK
jgi:HAE1 family hydrophobic/amphiphilic exporter-1